MEFVIKTPERVASGTETTPIQGTKKNDDWKKSFSLNQDETRWKLVQAFNGAQVNAGNQKN